MIHYIHSIELVPYHYLATHSTFSAEMREVYIEDTYFPWKELTISGLAELEESVEQSNGVNRFTLKMTATVPHCAFYRLPEERLLWRLTDSHGTEWLLGAPRREFLPHSVLTRALPGKSSDTSAMTLTVSLTSTLPLLQIVYI